MNHERIRPCIPPHPLESDAAEAFSRLVQAARDDDVFRRRVMFVLQLPPPQRESMVRSAVAEMRLRGEPVEIQAAFLALASEAGAQAAARLIKSD